MLTRVRNGLIPHFPQQIVDELLSAFQEVMRNYYLGGMRLNAVEGGRFCEAVLRMLEYNTTGTYTPIGSHIATEDIIRNLANLPSATFGASIRLHIPRAVRVVYDIRNNRDAAHLADGIDPNVQDATLVTSVSGWILAELVRIFNNVTPIEAQAMVNLLVTRNAPAVENFGDFLKVLNPELGASDRILLLLYQRGIEGAALDELKLWAKPKMRRNLVRTLNHLEHEKSFIHHDIGDGRYIITLTGMREVEIRKLFELN